MSIDDDEREHPVVASLGAPPQIELPTLGIPLPEIGLKRDGGKPRWDLLPYDALGPVVDVLTFGASKYDPWNWLHVADANDRYFSALQRHLVAWKLGERLDPESGLPHLAHAGCCLLFLLALELKAATVR